MPRQLVTWPIWQMLGMVGKSLELERHPHKQSSQVVLVVKNPPANAGDIRDEVPSLGWEDPLEEEMATRSSILARRIPWIEELAGCNPWGHKKSDTTEVWAHHKQTTEEMEQKRNIFKNSIFLSKVQWSWCHILKMKTDVVASFSMVWNDEHSNL